MKNNILIATAYNSRSFVWFELQKKYIFRSTISDFDYVIFNNSKIEFESNDAKVINYNCEKSGSEQHLDACNMILRYFNENSQYTHCLIIDSDAFPIMKNWDIFLDQKIKDSNFNIACPIRFENLDIFYHPCVVFFNRQGSYELSFNYSSMKNLMNYECKEFMVNSKNGKVFPLLKTNKYSPHPIISCIYYDMFYHHGFGSRDFFCRSIHINKYYKKDNDSPNELTNLIFENSESFLIKLLGKKVYD